MHTSHTEPNGQIRLMHTYSILDEEEVNPASSPTRLLHMRIKPYKKPASSEGWITLASFACSARNVFHRFFQNSCSATFAHHRENSRNSSAQTKAGSTVKLARLEASPA